MPAPAVTPAEAASDLEEFILESSRTCPDYPSLSHPDLPKGSLIRIPHVDRPLPVNVVRRAVLNVSWLFMVLCLRLDMEWFHLEWDRFCEIHPESAILGPRGFGKSLVCTSGRTCLLICRNFDDRHLLTAERDDQAKDLMQEVQGFLTDSPMLKALFGEFKGRGEWSKHKIVVRQRRIYRKEGTVVARQMGGSITGLHFEHIKPDDPTSDDTSNSEAARERAWRYLFSTLTPCRMPGGTFQIRATRYHYEDLLGRVERHLASDEIGDLAHVHHIEDVRAQRVLVERSPKMKVLKTSAITRETYDCEVCGRRHGRSLWERRSPIHNHVDPQGRIVKGLVEIRAEMGDKAFGEQFQMECKQPPKVGTRETLCREAWLEPYDAAPDYRHLRVAIAVDPAWTSAEKAARRASTRQKAPDWSAIAVCFHDPHVRNDPNDRAPAPNFWVEELEAGLWSELELESAMRRLAGKWADRLGARGMRIYLERTGLQIRDHPEFYKTIRELLQPHRVVFTQPQTNKVAHWRPFFVHCERRLVRLHPDVHASGFVEMCGDAPFGERDDEIDAVATAYRKLVKRRSNISGLGQRNKVTSGTLNQTSGAGARVVAARGMSGGRGW